MFAQLANVQPAHNNRHVEQHQKDGQLKGVLKDIRRLMAMSYEQRFWNRRLSPTRNSKNRKNKNRDHLRLNAIQVSPILEGHLRMNPSKSRKRRD